MRPYSHCQFEAEKIAFQRLEQLLKEDVEAVLFPNFDLFDGSRKTYLECDLLVLTKAFCAIVELKNWRGNISILPTHWERNGSIFSDPHKTNNRKCKVLKSSIQQMLPHVVNVPYVQSIVVLTHPEAEVEGDDSVFHEVGAWPISSQITFNGVEHLAEYLRKRTVRDFQQNRNILKDSEFKQIVDKFDILSQQVKEDYSDQIPGYRVIDELEHTEEYSTYLAEKVPALGGQRFRLRVFGEVSENAKTKATQTRSLQELALLPHHENILPAMSHPNEKKLVVEVSEWTDLETLENLLLKEGRIQWKTAAKIALGVARALTHIHNSSKLLVHRNVSPKSIILNSENIPKLTDFNLVYDPAASYTVYEATKELSPYQPPELLQGSVDFKSDIYSWGMTFYEMLAGDPLVKKFKDLPNTGMSDEHFARLPDDVPIEIKELLSKTIRLNVSERLEAISVVKELENILDIGMPTITHQVDASNTWQLIKMISEGATSHVYLGDCLGETAVLKLYKSDVGRDRCLQERDMLRLVSSPFVPRYKSFIQWNDGRWCLIEEVVKGDKLRDFIELGEIPTLSVFKEVSLQLLSAFIDMHPKDDSQDQMGVIHNDVNPNNILFDPTATRASLIDFGAASPPGPITFRGTYGYISNDLIENGEVDAQPKGDLYGLAVSLWEWITGNLPTNTYNLNEMTFTDLSEAKRLKLSEWFQCALANGKCSYASGNEMLEALDNVFNLQETIVEEKSVETAQAQLQEDEHLVNSFDISLSEKFVNYLNSIHNISANNNNALAESQSVSEFFGSIYVPFPIADEIYDLLTTHVTAPIIILTGHAGDGKSTIALDVLKRLRQIPSSSPLPSPPQEREIAFFKSRQITIVKDMSELSVAERYEIFSESLADDSSAWLIVSNTGPLLGTFTKYYEGVGADVVEQQAIENKLLEVLDRPIVGHISNESHGIDKLNKTVIAVNLTKLDNVEIATQILQKIVTHPAWMSCNSCLISDKCHISLNINTLTSVSDIVMDRIRWIYRRLTAYEQRMTLRQMSAHIAYSLTAGLNCEEMRSRLKILTSESDIRNQVAKFSFGEVFFGLSGMVTSSRENSIYVIQLLKKLRFGTQTSPQIERSIVEGKLLEWAVLPSVLKPVYEVFLNQSRKAENIAARCSQRKLLYLFADINVMTFPPANSFLSQFLQSSKVIELDEWRHKEALTLTKPQRRELTKNTLNVLLEEYSGNSAGQYDTTNYLYITLRRSDRQVFQATQLVLAKFDFKNFDIVYDEVNKLPKLVHRPQGTDSGLLLTLPLLDYIIKRGQGDLEDGLDPIYLNQLEYFRSQLLTDYEDDSNVINLLRVGIDGKVDSYSYEHLTENNTLDLLG